MLKKNISPSCKSDSNMKQKSQMEGVSSQALLLRWKEWLESQGTPPHKPSKSSRTTSVPGCISCEATQNQQGALWARRYTTFHSLHHYQFQNKGCIINKLLHSQTIRIWKKKRILLYDSFKGNGKSCIFRYSNLFKAWEVQGLVQKELRGNRKTGHETVSRKIVNCTHPQLVSANQPSATNYPFKASAGNTLMV